MNWVIKNRRKLATVAMPPVFGLIAQASFEVGSASLVIWLTVWPLWLACEIESLPGHVNRSTKGGLSR